MSVANGLQPRIDQNLAYAISSPNGSVALVGSSSSSQVIAANANRRGLIFSNPGNIAIDIMPANVGSVVSGQGIPVPTGGAPLEFIGDGALINYNCAWIAIAASSSGNALVILELV